MTHEAGWYPDPLNPDNELYFDGTKWTGEKRNKVIIPEDPVVSKEYSFTLPIPKKYLAKNRLVALVGIVALVIAGITFVKIQSENAAKEKASIARAEKAKAELDAALALEKIKNDVTWVPSGYTPWRDDKSVAWKWINNAGNDCYSCKYWTVQVVSKFGCPNGLYGEINIERNGIVISYTNDSLAYLGPSQTGRLTFETYLSGSFQGSLTELNCR